MNTPPSTESTIRPMPLMMVLCGAWLGAGLAAVPGIADAASPAGQTATAAALDSYASPQRASVPRPGCAATQGQRGRTASPVPAPTGERICRLAAAAEISIRNNPGIF